MISYKECKAIAEDILVEFVGVDMTDYTTMQKFVMKVNQCLQVFRQEGKVVTHDLNPTVIFKGFVIDSDDEGEYLCRVWEQLGR